MDTKAQFQLPRRHRLIPCGTAKSIYLALACLFCCTTQALAAQIPNSDKLLDLKAREQEFSVFMDALFQQLDVPLIVEDGIEGTINGRFSGRAADVLDEVTTAFNVVVYFDGVVAHLYKANQVSRKVYPASVDKLRRVYKMANDLSLPDDRNRLSVRNDSLLVSGTPRFIEQIAELFAASAPAPVKRQAPTPKPTPAPAAEPETDSKAAVYKVYRLKHAWANDTSFQVGGQSVTVPGVASILKSLVTEIPVSVIMSRGESTDARGSLDGLNGQGLSSLDRRAAGSLSSLEQITSGSGEEDIIRIVADPRLNAVIVRDTADRIVAYDSLIESLDVESRMVEIEATIIDINTDRARELGINWRQSFDEGDLLFGNGTESDLSLLPGTETITGQGRGGVLSLMLGEPGRFLGRIRALEERGAANIVSKPHVITLSDVEAVLGVSTEFFVRIAGNQEVDLFNVPVGTFLRVTPHVFGDLGKFRIKLLVNIEDGSQAGEQSVDSIPVVERSNINTQAVIDEGDSLLIGGLVREAYTKSDYRVPILGSIPLLGRLFRSDRNTTNRVERLFMITPRISDGVGFGATPEQGALAGRSQQIISDADKRLDKVSWPERAEQPYWPDEDKPAGKSAAVAQTDNLANQSLTYEGRTLPKIISPYTVEVWQANHAGQ